MKYIIKESQMVKVVRLLHEEESKELKIKKIQQFLVDMGYDLGDYGEEGNGVDGNYGDLTKKAVEDFQRDKGYLQVDGKVGPETAKAMGIDIEPIFYKKEDKVKKNTEVKKQSETKKEPAKINVKKSESTTDDEYVIIKPQGYTGNKVHVLFGGHSTNPSYSSGGASMGAMKKYINVLSPYANGVIIVVTHHMNSLENVKKYVKQKFGGVVSSIAGFSQGGKETWKHADDGSLSLVGLVDPSTYETGLTFGPNTILYCDPKNWGTSGFYGETRRRLEWYCDNQKKYGGKVICFYKGGTHMNFGILKDFYSQFGGKL